MKPLLFLLFCSLGVSAQKADYLKYHSYIIRAEENLVDDKADSAFFYYDKAFGEFGFIFARDAFAAAQFAWKHKDRDRTTRYLIKGSYSGLRSKDLDESKILRDYVNSRFYDAVYDSMKAGNLAFGMQVDQGLRTEWMQRQGELIVAEDEAATIDVVERNVARLKELLSAKKYPGGAVAGLSEYFYEMENYSAYHSLAKYDCVITEMHEALWTAVKNGQLHPRDFAALWEREQMLWKGEQHANVPGGSARITNRKCPGMKPVAMHFKIVPSLWQFTDEEIDKDRAQYYIGSIETDRKKKKLEEEQGYILFFGPREENGMVEFH